MSWAFVRPAHLDLGRLERLCYPRGVVAMCSDAPLGRPLFEQTVRAAILVREVLEVILATGTIKKVVADRGFGFIIAEDEKEYFFHRAGLDASLDFDRLQGGESVEFDVEQSPKGPRAANVRAA